MWGGCGEVGVVRCVWGGECVCVCGEVGVRVGRWVWVWGVRCGCDVGGCGRWVQVMEHVKIEGVDM